MKLHHVGMVVKSIAGSGPDLARAVCVQAQGPVCHDPAQQVSVQFFAGAQDHVSIELIEPAGAGSPVLKFLQNGGGLAHLCYEVPDITEALDEALANGAVLVSGPSPAAAFQGRSIAFLYFRGAGLIEFLESAK